MGSDMAKNWRLSSISGALLALYFIPVWTMIAFRIMVSPVQGLYERPNIAFALFASDHLHLAGLATVRFGWLLALVRITVVAFFALFLLFITRPSIRRSGGHNEALAMALEIGIVISFAGVLAASLAGEIAAVRMHAAELLMMLGTAIVMLVELPVQRQVEVSAASGGLSLQQS
jgi:hypothetical protein